MFSHYHEEQQRSQNTGKAQPHSFGNNFSNRNLYKNQQLNAQSVAG